MEATEIIKFVSALLFVLALMGGLAFIMKRLNAGTLIQTAGRRLRVVETLALDHRRRLVLVERDGTQHLLLLGTTQEIVVEQGITESVSRETSGQHVE